MTKIVHIDGKATDISGWGAQARALIEAQAEDDHTLERKLQVIMYLHEHGIITRREVRRLMGVEHWLVAFIRRLGQK